MAGVEPPDDSGVDGWQAQADGNWGWDRRREPIKITAFSHLPGKRQGRRRRHLEDRAGGRGRRGGSWMRRTPT